MCNIPKRLHMQYFWQTPCQWQLDNVAEWQSCNPEWELWWWDTEPDDVPQNIKEALKLAPTPRFRADLLRYWTLWMYGGVYVDIDTRPIIDRNLNDLLQELGSDCTDFFSRYRSPRFPDNYFIGGVEGSQWWETALKRAMRSDGWRRPNRYFGAANAFSDITKHWPTVKALTPSHVIEIQQRHELYELFDRTPLRHDTAFLKHYRTCGKKSLEFLGDYNQETWEEGGLQGNVPDEPKTCNAPNNDNLNYHEMPNGDLVVDPGGKIPDKPPRGYYRDEEQPYRFHPKPKQSLSDTVQQGAEKRRNCPSCNKQEEQ